MYRIVNTEHDITERKQADEALHNLIEIIQFTEHVSTKLHGLLSEAEIYRTVKEEFAQLKRYITSIVLLTDDDSSLRIAEASLSPAKVKAIEKATGLRLKGYKIDLKKSSTYRQVVREGKTVQVSASDITGELFPRPLARLVLKALGVAKESSILTPLKRHGKIIGAFALTAPELAEHFMPSVRNLAQHISNALEWADENSERKQAEEALRESEEKYRTIVENVGDQIVHLNKYGTIIYANDKEAIFGRKPEEIMGKNFTKLGYFDVKDIPKYLKLFKDVITGKKKLNELELEIKHKDGHIIPVEVSTSLIKKNGKIEGFLCMIKDITERKRAEEALRESEERYRKLFEEARDGIFLADVETGVIVDCNRAAAELVGRDKSELIGQHQKILHPPRKINGKFTESFKKHLEDSEGQVLEEQVITSSGEIKEVAIKANLLNIGGRKLLQGMFRDITDRQRTEEALRESEERFRILLETSPDGILIDQDGSLIFANSAYQKMFGIKDLSRRLGKPYSPIIAPRDRERVLAISAAREAGEAVPTTYEFTGRRADGAEFPVEVTAARLVHNEQLATMAILRDITERKRAEEALRESEGKYRSLVESTDDAVYLISLDMRYEFANRKYLSRLGLSLAELVGQEYGKLHPWDTNKEFEKKVDQVIKSGKPMTYEYFSQRDNKYFMRTLSPVTGEKPGEIKAITITSKDITEHKRAEEALKRSNKELKQFAFAASHDLQEPLRTITSFAQLLSERYKGQLDSSADEYLHYIVEGTTQMSARVKGLLAVSKVGAKVVSLENVSMEAVLQQVLAGLKNLVEQSHAEITWDTLPEIRANRDQMAQLFQNLLENAIKFRGTEDPRIHINSQTNTSTWEFCVQDNGIGIEPEYHERIFELFHRISREDEHSGTGIGLAICQRIVEGHGGWIWAESEGEGKGSRFYMVISKHVR